MLRLLADENFNGDIVRGLRRRAPDLDLVRVQDVGLGGADDPAVLAWAAQHDRILLTHDRATMPAHAYERLVTGHTMPGIFIFDSRLSVGPAVQEILLLVECSRQEEWNGQVVHLPL